MTWTNLHLAFLLIHHVDDLVLPHRLPSLIVTIGNVRAEDWYERSRRWAMNPVNFCPWIYTVRPTNCVLRSIMQPKRCHACMRSTTRWEEKNFLLLLLLFNVHIINHPIIITVVAIIQHNLLLNVRIFVLPPCRLKEERFQFQLMACL